jgi:hypothetical protein
VILVFALAAVLGVCAAFGRTVSDPVKIAAIGGIFSGTVIGAYAADRANRN